MPTSTNRTKWPVKGGAVAVQPGWFQGHSKAFIYINIGFGTIPPNMSHIMVPVFQIQGPTNKPYPGTFCLPQVPLPPNINVTVGDHATIQVIEAAQHGAALFNVSFYLFLFFFFLLLLLYYKFSCHFSWSDTNAILQCVDIEFADPADVEQVTPENCFNSSDINFADVFTTTSLSVSSSEAAMSRLDSLHASVLVPSLLVAALIWFAL